MPKCKAILLRPNPSIALPEEVTVNSWQGIETWVVFFTTVVTDIIRIKNEMVNFPLPDGVKAAKEVIIEFEDTEFNDAKTDDWDTPMDTPSISGVNPTGSIAKTGYQTHKIPFVFLKQ